MKDTRLPIAADAEPTDGADPRMSRRDAVKAIGAGTLAAGALGTAACSGDGRPTALEAIGGFFQKHYKKMTPAEIEAAIARLEKRYGEKYGIEVRVENTPPIPGVVFGYAIDISRCKGYRDCVKACVEENNQGRNSGIEYIRVLEIDRGTMDLETSDHYFDHEVPAPGKFYLPVQCHQCENSPCISACPVEATWQEPDGIVVIDQDWCIGCRYCATACPYWSRKFNWMEPEIPPEELNPNTHYLSNRPRTKGVMEKCTFCLQRTRKGQNPACMEACPTGARVFGNLLDPDSEIRYVLENKTVFRLKEELNTEPKFWYFTD